MSIDRRRVMAAGSFALAALALPARFARAELSSAFEERPLEVGGSRLARRCLLLVPKGGSERLLVLMHGLGETTSEAAGVRAWFDRYGLGSADARLRRPPLARTLKDANYLSDERLSELNGELGRRPYRGLAVACPFTPNVYAAPSTDQALAGYAEWVAGALLPELKRELGLAESAGAVGLDGVSLGGFVSLEVFLRHPQAFAAAGSLQGAFGMRRVASFAERLERAFERVGPRPLRIATTSADPGRKANERLVAKLRERGIDAGLALGVGPHDQRFLREAGTLELLLHYDRTLRPVRAAVSTPAKPPARGVN